MALRCTTVRYPIGISGWRGFCCHTGTVCSVASGLDGLYKIIYHEWSVHSSIYFRRATVALELKDSSLFIKRSYLMKCMLHHPSVETRLIQRLILR
jgi:hypothetical protein